jgi:hypothetical protein
MKVFLKIVAVVLVFIAAFLIYSVIAAIGSAGGAKPAVAIGYVIGAAVLAFVASRLWRRPTRA